MTCLVFEHRSTIQAFPYTDLNTKFKYVCHSRFKLPMRIFLIDFPIDLRKKLKFGLDVGTDTCKS